MTGAQPSSMEPYLQPENPVTRNPLEEKATKHLEHHQHQHPGPSAKEAKPASQPQQHAGAAGGIPSALGRGVRGVDAQEAEVTAAAAGVGGHRDELQNENVNADEALATLAEGDVADAYQRKSGTQKVPGSGPAEEQDFASDLDRYVQFLLLVFLFSFLFLLSPHLPSSCQVSLPSLRREVRHTGRKQNKQPRARTSRRLGGPGPMLMEALRVAG